jgi:rare lipoprotein A
MLVLLFLVSVLGFGLHLAKKVLSSHPESSPGIQGSNEGRANSQTAQLGGASWYSVTSKTANGEQMDDTKMTAAHPSLPFGTEVEVENLYNGRKAFVRVNDRGPFVANRIIDVSKAAARTLDMISDGVVTVRIRPLIKLARQTCTNNHPGGWLGEKRRPRPHSQVS